MSKEFRPHKDDLWAVRWNEFGGFDLNKSEWNGIGPDDIPAFIAWLQEGPPKKRWRIKSGVTFPNMPDMVAMRMPDGSTRHTPLSGEMIEEVWE